MTFEKHLRSVSRVTYHGLGILRKSWLYIVFHDRFLHGGYFRGLSCRSWVLFCSVVLGADTHLNYWTMQSVVPDFLTRGVFEYDIEDRWSEAVLWMLYTIRCNPMHPLYGAPPGPYKLVWAIRGALVAYRNTYAPPRCRTSQYLRTCIPMAVSLWNDLGDPVFDGVGLAGFKSRANAIKLADLLSPILSPLVFPFSSFNPWVDIVGLGSSDSLGVNRSRPA